MSRRPMTSRRRTLFGAMAAAVCLALAACSGGATESSGDPNAGAVIIDGSASDHVLVSDKVPTPKLPVTVTGADGTKVEVTDVDRIIPLTGGIAEIVFSLGLGDNVVGRDISTTFAEAEDLPVVTRAHDISAEGVLSLRPTIVIGDTDTGPPEVIKQLRRAGVKVLLVEQAWSLEEIPERVRQVATALGVPAAGERLITRTERQVAAAREAAPDSGGPKIAFLYMRGTAAVYLLGGAGSGADSLVEAIGARDAGKESGLDKRFTQLTPEALVAAAPDVILVMTKGLDSVGGVDGLVKLPGIAQTPAGQNRKVIAMDDGLLLNFGPRTGTVLQELSEAVYGTAASAPATAGANTPASGG